MKFKGTFGKWHSVEYAGNYILQSGDNYGDDNILDAERRSKIFQLYHSLEN